MWTRRLTALVLSFVLGTYGGYVALLRDGDPVRIYEVPADRLPREDQQALRRGISPRTGPELTALLEDFLS